MNIIDIEKGLIKRYRHKIYSKFIKAIQEYQLLEDNDVIGVCMSGGKDSFVLAKLFQELVKYGTQNLKVKFLVMNPGFNEANLTKLKENANKFGIPIIIKDSNIFKVVEKHGKNQPCYLCARMRRGFLYEFAQSEGCNKIALGHHFNDVIETILLNIFYAGTYKTMLPKLKSENFKGMEIIRPMVYIEEKDIINYMNYCKIEAMSCGCKIASGEMSSKRKEMKQLIATLKKNHREIDKSIYRSSQNVNLNCVLKWSFQNKEYSFLDYHGFENDEE